MLTLSVFLTLKKKNQNNQQKQEDKKYNETKVSKINGVHLYWPTILGHQACSRLWLIYPVTLHWRKLIFPFSGGINCKLIIDTLSCKENAKLFFSQPTTIDYCLLEEAYYLGNSYLCLLCWNGGICS